MKLKINLSCREDRYIKKYPVEIFSGNIKPVNDSNLPNCKDKYINFVSGYSPIYADESDGLVNTRFSYPYSAYYKKVGTAGVCKIYAKLNWWQRRKLNIIEKKSIFHKHPFKIAFLIVNIIGFIPLLNSLFSNHEQYNQAQTPNSQIILQDTTKGSDSLQLEQIDSPKEKK